jgi:hypothetical protein
MCERIYVWQEWPLYFRGLARMSYQLARDMSIDRTDDDRVYFTDKENTRWRVHDVSYGSPHAQPHHYKRFNVGDTRATSRIFVSGLSEKRSYTFGKGEARKASGNACEAQLRRAAYLGRGAFDARTHGPT